MDANEVTEQLQGKNEPKQKEGAKAVVLAQNTLVHQQWLTLPMTRSALAALDKQRTKHLSNLLNMSVQVEMPAESVKTQAAMLKVIDQSIQIVMNYKHINQLNEQQ